MHTGQILIDESNKLVCGKTPEKDDFDCYNQNLSPTSPKILSFPTGSKGE